MKINVRTRNDILHKSNANFVSYPVNGIFSALRNTTFRIYNISVFVPNPISGIHHNDKLYISICVSTLPDGLQKNALPLTSLKQSLETSTFFSDSFSSPFSPAFKKRTKGCPHFRSSGSALQAPANITLKSSMIANLANQLWPNLERSLVKIYWKWTSWIITKYATPKQHLLPAMFFCCPKLMASIF